MNVVRKIKRREFRRLKYLIDRTYNPVSVIVDGNQKLKFILGTIATRELESEALAILKSIGITSLKEIREIWNLNKHSTQVEFRKWYIGRTKGSGKRRVENPNVYNGEKGTPYLARVPKKCRKTAWKRYYKNCPYTHPDPKFREKYETESWKQLRDYNDRNKDKELIELAELSYHFGDKKECKIQRLKNRTKNR